MDDGFQPQFLLMGMLYRRGVYHIWGITPDDQIGPFVNPFAKSGKGVESCFRVNGTERGHGVKHLSN